MNPALTTTAIAALIVLGTAAGAPAQDANGFVAIEDWDQDRLYERDLLSGEWMLEAEVYDETGEDLGEVENIFVSDDGQIVAIGAEVGGFLDIGDTHVIVPWEEVETVADGFAIPIDEDVVEEYEIGGEQANLITSELGEIRAIEGGDVWTAGGTFRLSDLVGDMAMLSDGGTYGYVDNVYFSTDGKLEAVVVEATSAYGGGVYGYPYRGMRYGWNPYGYGYNIGYGPGEVADVPQLDTEDVTVVYGED